MHNLSRKLIKSQKKDKTSIVMFGEGNFLRAFVLHFIHELNEQSLINEGVVVVQPMPFGRVKELKEQDGLYTLFLEGLKDSKEVKETKLINCINDLINPFIELEKYLSYAKSRDLKTIISNTTEAGIVYEEEMLNETETPNSFPGKLLLLLKSRYDEFKNDNFKFGLNIVPCELIDENGNKLKEILVKLSKFNNYNEDFINWLENDNYYYNTLVDRIVPGFPFNDKEDLEKELGYIDNSMVKGEIFHLWAIEGPSKLKEDLPFDKAGLDVLFVDSIKPYKERKVKILNGSHTALVPVAYLANKREVRESLLDVDLNKFLNNFIYEEVIPTINLPEDEMNKFSKDVIDRFLNPFVHHKLMDISLNSMTKYKTRILPTVTDLLNEGKFPKYSLFSLAAQLVFYRGLDLEGNKIELKDEPELIKILSDLWRKDDVKLLVEEVVKLPHWETNVLNNKQVIDYLIEKIESILENKIKYSLKEI